jgi:hypothetical protein
LTFLASLIPHSPNSPDPNYNFSGFNTPTNSGSEKRFSHSEENLGVGGGMTYNPLQNKMANTPPEPPKLVRTNSGMKRPLNNSHTPSMIGQPIELRARARIQIHPKIQALSGLVDQGKEILDSERTEPEKKVFLERIQEQLKIIIGSESITQLDGYDNLRIKYQELKSDAFQKFNPPLVLFTHTELDY